MSINRLPINLGNRRELFIDDHLISRTYHDTRLKLHSPERGEIVFQVQPPLENACSGVYSVIIEKAGKYLLYYRGNYPLQNSRGDLAKQQTANLAISEDGINFSRPELGIYKLSDEGRNNVVWQGIQAHNLVPFHDPRPDCPADQQFKAVGGTGRDKLYALFSPDGFNWRLAQPEPLAVSGAFDSANVAFWDTVKQKYRLFSRDFVQHGEKRYRMIQSCESDDFLSWTAPVPHQYEEGIPLEQFYTNATTPCPGAEHILLSFPMRYVAERTTPVRDISAMDYPGTSKPGMTGMTDAVIMSSRDGVHWKRPFMEAWLRAGLDNRNWTHRNNCPAIGILPLRRDEWSMYVSEHYGWPDNRLRRLKIRPWGWGSLNGGFAGGEAITKPLVFNGNQLQLNFSTSAVGLLRVELQDEQSNPIPGYTIDDCDEIFGDQLDRPVSWRGKTDLHLFANRSLCLRFELKDADLYAIQFVQA